MARIGKTVVQAREAARKKTGQFGEQVKARPAPESFIPRERSVQLRMAKDPTTPLHVLDLLADCHPDVQIGVMLNPNVQPDILERLSASDQWHVRLQVAANNRSPLHVLERLEEDSSERVSWYAKQTLDTLGKTQRDGELLVFNPSDLPQHKGALRQPCQCCDLGTHRTVDVGIGEIFPLCAGASCAEYARNIARQRRDDLS